jgi:hypothetical protein
MTTRRRHGVHRHAHAPTARAALGAGVVCLLLTAGCSSSGGGPSVTKIPIKFIALSPADVGAALDETVTVKLTPAGTTISTNEATLAECSAVFPSEKLRRQRLQQDYYDEPDRISASTEVVRYKSGGAAKAYAEETAAVKKCPTTVDQTKNVSGRGLEKERVATTSKVLNSDGSLVYSASIYQWKNDLLNAVYVYRGTPTQALGLAVKLAKAAAKKLDAAR